MVQVSFYRVKCLIHNFIRNWLKPLPSKLRHEIKDVVLCPINNIYAAKNVKKKFKILHESNPCRQLSETLLENKPFEYNFLK